MQPRWTHRAAIAALVSVIVGACTGLIDDPSATEEGAERRTGVGTSPSAACERAGAGRTLVRVLSKTEHDNTLADLLGTDAVRLAASPGAGAWGFDNDARDLGVPPAVLDAQLAAAAQAAAIVRAQLDLRLGCDRAAGATCAREFLRAFGRRAYRRPVSEDALSQLMTLFELGEDFDAGVELAVQGMLSSAQFLYRTELGVPTDGTRRQLTGWEIASRLSYFLWASTPDDALLDAAERGELDDVPGIVAQAERMLDDERARRSVRHLHSQWLELEKLDGAARDPALHPAFDAELREDLKEETLAFVEAIVFEGGTVSELFDADFTMMNARVAELYGVAGVTSDAHVRVAVDPAERAGLLTQASVLAARASFDRTSPIKRGAFVRRQILCQELPTPPNDVPMLPDPVAEETERERLDRHRNDPACNGCHTLIDPVGFAFEQYDAVGRFRAVDHDGSPVNAEGELTDTEDANGSVEGAIELSRRLAQSEQVERCVIEQWTAYALARNDRDDECIVRDLHATLGRDFVLRDLVVAIVTSDGFRYREAFEATTCE